MANPINVRAIRSLLSRGLLKFRRKLVKRIDDVDAVTGFLVPTDDPVNNRIEFFVSNDRPSSRSSRL